MASLLSRSVTLGTLSLFLAAPLAATAEDKPVRQATISVTGEGDAAIVPDMAVLSFSVMKQAETAAAALSQNSSTMTEVQSSLKAAGIAERDMQTTNFSVQPVYKQVEPKDGIYVPPDIIGYQVTNGLTVRVRDLKKLGPILDSSIKLGINQGGDIAFTNDNPEAVVTEARKKAIENALSKAKTLSEAAGVKVGRVIEINENGPRPMPVPPTMMMRASMEKSDSVPIAAGENSYKVTVNVTFAIDQP